MTIYLGCRREGWHNKDILSSSHILSYGWILANCDDDEMFFYCVTNIRVNIHDLATMVRCAQMLSLLGQPERQNRFFFFLFHLYDTWMVGTDCMKKLFPEYNGYSYIYISLVTKHYVLQICALEPDNALSEIPHSRLVTEATN